MTTISCFRFPFQISASDFRFSFPLHPFPLARTRLFHCPVQSWCTTVEHYQAVNHLSVLKREKRACILVIMATDSGMIVFLHWFDLYCQRLHTLYPFVMSSAMHLLYLCKRYFMSQIPMFGFNFLFLITRFLLSTYCH